MERAAEEEVGEAPERVEDGVVNEVAFDVVLDGVEVVNSNHDGQSNAAVEQVDHAKALHTDVGHCLQGSLTPLHVVQNIELRRKEKNLIVMRTRRLAAIPARLTPTSKSHVTCSIQKLTPDHDNIMIII